MLSGNTIMIIGAGLGQIPAIKRSKELGLRVIAVDRNPRAPGMPLADISLDLDVVDFKGILSAARKYGINGIMTMQSDLPVPTIGSVNDAMHLTGVSLETAQKCSNKVQTRKCFQQAGVPQPDFRVASDFAEVERAVGEIGIPCVVKAPDSSGSRGVVKIDQNTNVKMAYDEALQYSQTGEVLVEAYVAGLEVGAQAFSYHGECKIVLVHNDTLSPPPYMIPVGHSFPFKGNADQIKEIENICAESISALGIADGPSNIDIIVDEQGQAQIIEVGARIGATCLPELVQYYSGIDWVEATILSCLGLTPDLKVTQESPTAALILESSFNGILKDVHVPADIDSRENVIEWELTAGIGDQVACLTKGTDRIGKILLHGLDVESAELEAQQIKDRFIFKA